MAYAGTSTPRFIIAVELEHRYLLIRAKVDFGRSLRRQIVRIHLILICIINHGILRTCRKTCGFVEIGSLNVHKGIELLEFVGQQTDCIHMALVAVLHDAVHCSRRLGGVEHTYEIHTCLEAELLSFGRISQRSAFLGNAGRVVVGCALTVPSDKALVVYIIQQCTCVSAIQTIESQFGSTNIWSHLIFRRSTSC